MSKFGMRDGCFMTMTVKNNAAVMYALNQLGRNDSDLAKQLKKVASGMRINGAADDASGYAISMRLRSLEGAYGQDIQNAQTGANLVAVAEGGIQSVVDNLRTMKEMMLNARNDTNTDVDRETIQKEFEKRIETITDIAAETNYNGKLLLNGQYSSPREYEETKIIEIVTPKTIHIGPPSVTVVPESSPTGDPVYGITQDNKIEHLADNFAPANGGTALRNNQSVRGKTCSQAYDSSEAKVQIKIDFSGATVDGNPAEYPSDFDGQGFAVLCNGCPQYINIKFDANTTASTYNPHPNVRADGDYSGDWAREYVIGIKGVSDEASLEEAVFNGIKNAANRVDLWKNYVSEDQTKKINGADFSIDAYLAAAVDTDDSISVDPEHNLRIAKNPSGDGYIFERDRGPTIGIFDEGIYLTKTTTTPGTEGVPSEGTTIVDEGYDTTILETSYKTLTEKVFKEGNPLIIHTGAKQNQYLPVFINSMHPIALGINGARVDDDRILDKTEPLGDPSVNKFAALLKQVDDAIDYTLNEIVRMGAYRQRLSMTEDNLTTAQENTVNAKSTIADADMAKEMTGYTKANVLAQTAQSMVAQANQNSSAVLGLLQ